MADRRVLLPDSFETDVSMDGSGGSSPLRFVSEQALRGTSSPRFFSHPSPGRSPRGRSSVARFLAYNPLMKERLQKAGVMPDMEVLFVELDKQVQRYQEELAAAKVEGTKLQESLEEEQQKSSEYLVSELALQTQVKNLQQQNDSLKEENGKLQSSLLTEQQQLQEDLQNARTIREQLTDKVHAQAMELQKKAETNERLEKDVKDYQKRLIRALDKSTLVQEQQHVDHETRLALQSEIQARDEELAVAMQQLRDYEETLDEVRVELQLVAAERDSAELCMRNIVTKRRIGQEVAMTFEKLNAELRKVKNAVRPAHEVNEITPLEYIGRQKVV